MARYRAMSAFPCAPADGHPLVFAHRGGALLAPENTLAAFDAGLAAGADGLELDVRLSRDGIVVVHHDATLERTTSGRGAVAGFTADELAGLDAAAQFDVKGARVYRGAGFGVPCLAEVLRRYRDVPIIIELKGTSRALAHAAVETVRAADAVDRVCFGGFSLVTLRAVRSAGPEITTSAAHEETRWALYRSWLRWPVRNAPYRVYQVPELSGRTRVVSPRFVRLAHEIGRAVQVWTVNDLPDMTRLLDIGVDALISDRPDLAVEAVRKRRL
jgi:glycerophosphoryl diester phosphodiesterase